MLTMPTTSRRDILLGGTAASALLGLTVPLFAQDKISPKFSGKLPPQLFRPVPGGMAGPWGEVRTVKTEGRNVPFFIQSADKGGTFDFSGRTAIVRLGEESSGLSLTAEGFAIGKGKRKPIKGNFAELVKAIRGNRSWMRSAMQLRAVFASAYPVFVAQQKASPPKEMGVPFLSALQGLGEAANCTTTVVVDQIVRRVERTIDIVLTAQEQYAACYDEAVKKGFCGFLGSGNADAGKVCAVTYCVGKGFVDVVTGLLTVWDDVVDEVTRDVTTCVKPIAGYLPNDWNVPEFPIPKFEEPDFIRVIREGILQSQDILAALALLRSKLDTTLAFLGPFRCLIEGNWSLATLPIFAGIGVPFGVEVCINAAAARSLMLQNIASDGVRAWSGALSLLATFNGGAAAALAAINVVPIAELATAMAAIGPAAIAAGAAISAMIVLILYHATMISAQITALVMINPDVLSDNKLCIVHPALAAAAVSALTLGTLSPVALVPPVVIG